MPLGDQFIGQAGTFAHVAANKFSGPFDCLLDRADPQFPVRDTQNDLRAWLEAELAANFGGNDDPSTFGHFRSECSHVRVGMSCSSIVAYNPIYDNFRLHLCFVCA
jgi:hypothetical protein